MVNKQDKIKGFERRKNSTPYLIVIQGIQALSLKDTKFGRAVLSDLGQLQAPQINVNANYFVEYHATLHSNQDPSAGL